MVSRRVALAGGAVVAVVLLAIVGGAVALTTFERPTVESTEYRWGTVNASGTEIQTLVTVENPNPIGIPGIVDVAYTARLNDVAVADGAKSGIGFPPGNTTVTVNATMDNSVIVDWWVTHVNGGEESSLSVDATVSGPGFERAVPAEDRTVETDALDGMNGDRNEEITADGRAVLTVEGVSAEWGEATTETTPIQTATTVQNEAPTPLDIRNVRYVVTLNDVTLANRTASETYTVAPEARETLDLRMALDSTKMDEWWVAHVRDDEVSALNVTVYATVDSRTGTERVTIDSLSEDSTIETSLAAE